MSKNTKTYKDIEKRSFEFAIRIIKMIDSLPKKTACFVIGKQLIESATSISSNIVHARASLSKKEFIYYMNNANKEAKETRKWIKMLVACNFLKESQIQDLLQENNEIISILITIGKHAQKNK